MSNDKYSRLSKRMYNRGPGNKVDEQPEEKQRKRYTIYVDRELITALNLAHKQINHDFFPAEVQKSLFLETMIQFGLDNIEQVKEVLNSLESKVEPEGADQ